MADPGEAPDMPARLGSGETRSRDVLVYRLEDRLYVNVTNTCTASCSFCPREERPVIDGHDLGLASSHSPADFVKALDAALAAEPPEEIVFCGFGEPTLRMDVLLAVARHAHEAGVAVRLNTNGHGELLSREPVLSRLQGLVDSISVSLNAPDEETYEALVRPHRQGAFAAAQAFIRAAVALGFDVTATAVDCLEPEQIVATAALAGELGARFRLRPLW